MQNAGSLSGLVPGLKIWQKEKGIEDLGGCELQFCAHGCGKRWKPSLPLVPYRSRQEGTGRSFGCPFHSISEVKNVSRIKVLDKLGSIIAFSFSLFLYFYNSEPLMDSHQLYWVFTMCQVSNIKHFFNSHEDPRDRKFKSYKRYASWDSVKFKYLPWVTQQICGSQGIQTWASLPSWCSFFPLFPKNNSVTSCNSSYSFTLFTSS